jgi:hypothetical protein
MDAYQQVSGMRGHRATYAVFDEAFISCHPRDVIFNVTGIYERSPDGDA